MFSRPGIQSGHASIEPDHSVRGVLLPYRRSHFSEYLRLGWQVLVWYEIKESVDPAKRYVAWMQAPLAESENEHGLHLMSGE